MVGQINAENESDPSDAARRQSLGVHYGRLLEESHSSRWSLSNLGNQATIDERNVVMDALLRRNMSRHRGRVLDLGCGASTLLSGLESYHRIGLDLLFERLETTDKSNGDLVNADGCNLPFAPETFDVVLLFTTLSSITDERTRSKIAAETQRVLNVGGVVIFYDMRYPSPRNRQMRRVGKRDLLRLFPGFDLHVRSLTLLPPVARRLGTITNRLYPALASAKPLRSHLGGVLVKR
jgi:SAM-dependent methyltransferase